MIEVHGLEFRYGGEDFQLHLRELVFPRGETAAITGASGSGKTTLLHLLAGILLPSRGSIRFGETVVSELSDGARRNFRAVNIGMVFQDFELIEYLCVLENILLPFRINRTLSLDAETRAQAEDLASKLGIDGLLLRRIDHLSQGERQRVGICRALLSRPQAILADEPTGNLDSRNAKNIMERLLACAGETGATLIAVTHDHSLLAGFDRVIDIQEFQVED